jgi:integrase
VTPKIGIFSVRGRLRLRLPRAWFDGRQVIFSLGLTDNAANRRIATEVVAEIGRDFRAGKLDRTFVKYGKQLPQKTTSPPTIGELWSKYCLFKKGSLKPATQYYWEVTLGRHIFACPILATEALEAKKWFLERTTGGMLWRIMSAVTSSIRWANTHDIIEKNIVSQWESVLSAVRKKNSDPRPNALTDFETSQLLEAIERSKPHYTCFVKFLFLTGCRPSEAIGLTWRQISLDGRSILFDRSIIRLGGRIVKNERSKTNRVRIFPTPVDLAALLLDLPRRSPSDLVFPSPKGDSIDYSNFRRKVWHPLAKPILGRSSTPYSCRDSFITRQIAAGKPLAAIAKWVDTSIPMIEERYFDLAAIDILPD